VGVLFDDSASLRDGLQAVLESNGDPEPQTATRVAFAYVGDATGWVGVGEELYESEPVARAVLDRCDELLRGEHGPSLLEAMFGQSGAVDGRALAQPVAFALECALTALWASVGIQPSTVFGAGTGDLAAAHAAGIITLEEGLRLAAAREAAMAVVPGTDESPAVSLDAALADIAFAPAQVTLVSSTTGRMIESSEVQDAGYWTQRSERELPLERTARTLQEVGIDLVIEIGPQREPGPGIARCSPSAAAEGGGPLCVLTSLADRSDGFVRAVAKAYESGLSINLAGLFAGERRSRISLPSYPFQRRRFWFNAR